MNAQKRKPSPLEKPSSLPTYLIGGVAIVVVAAVVIVGVVWQSKRNETRNEGYGSVQNSAVQVALQPDGVVKIGMPNAPKTIDLFEDAMCPFCAQLERINGQEVAKAIDDGKIAVQYHLMDFLNQLSASKDYSTRAVAASQCVAETGDAKAYSAFHAALFDPKNQPKERGSSDHSNAELAKIAADAGANDAAQQCISSGAKAEQAAAAAKTADDLLTKLAAPEKPGTPAVYDGTTKIDTSDPTWVTELG